MTLQHPFTHVATCCAAAWLLSACGQPDAEGTLRGSPAAHSESAKATWGASDPSLPSADSAFRPVNEPRADPAALRANPTLTPAQESSAMPMPGQNNDHSAPATAAKPASRP